MAPHHDEESRGMRRGSEAEDIEHGREKGGEASARKTGSASNFATYLKGIGFPVNKQNLLRHVEHNGAPDEIKRDVQNMPERDYSSVADIMKGFGQVK